MKKYIIIVPIKLEKLSHGFLSYSGTEKIVCEASSMTEAFMKYPQAIVIQPLQEDDRIKKTYGN